MNPIIFMKSNLNSYMDSNEKFKKYLAYCFKNDIKMMSPSVNESEELFTVVGKEEGIRYGLKGLSSIDALSKLILLERRERGKFLSYPDFGERMVKYHKITKSQLENLIFSGALDEFEGTKKAKIQMIPIILLAGKKEKKEAEGQFSIFDLAEENNLEDILAFKEIKTPVAKEFDKDFLLEKEKESTGFYITAHPMDDYEPFIASENITPLILLEGNETSNIESLEADAPTCEKIDDSPVIEIGSNVKVAGIITEVKNIITKHNELMLKCKIEDKTGSLSLICFAKQVDINRDCLVEGAKIIVNGKYDCNDFGSQVIVKSTVNLEKELSRIKVLHVRSNSDLDIARNQWKELQKILDINANIGDVTIIFEQFKKEGKSKKFIFPRKINITMNNYVTLQNIFGNDNCKLTNK